MRTPRIVVPRPPDPLQDWIDRTLALKRLQAQTSERARTEPVVKVETPVGYVSPGILTSLASSIRDIVGRVM